MRIQTPTVLAATVLFSLSTMARPKPSAPCVVYFTIAEHDEITVGLTMQGLNKPQNSWYRKHGDRGKLAGICYAAKPSDAPAAAPLYAITWGEHLMSEPYTYTTRSTETVNGNSTATNNSGGTANISTTADVPVEHTHSGVKRYYVADGWLAVWDAAADGPGGKGKGNFVPISPLHNHNFTVLTSASTSLLKDAMGQIADRERARLAK